MDADLDASLEARHASSTGRHAHHDADSREGKLNIVLQNIAYSKVGGFVDSAHVPGVQMHIPIVEEITV